MTYPTISEYIESIKYAEDNFATLTNLRPVLDKDGNPVMSSGNFAVVFKMQDIETNDYFAIKCFTREQDGREDAYRKIANELIQIDSPYMVSIKYLENELFVDTNQSDEKEFPLLIMDWVEGITLDKYIRENVDNKDTIALLMSQFCRFALWLAKQPFAHGDLKLDNILVCNDGALVLIDYDGMYVPAMRGEKAREFGSPNFRHPLYNEIEFSKHIDDFSLSLLIFTIAFANKKTKLFKTMFYEKNCLLQDVDFIDFDISVIYNEACNLLKFHDFARVFSLFNIILSEKTLDTDTLIFQLECILHDSDNNLLFNHAQELCNGGKANQADKINSFYIFQLLKEQNHTDSLLCYACCLQNGYGCLQQVIKSVILIKEVAELGHARAQRNLGICYEKGRGVEQDYLKAVEWYTKAAEQGDATAQLNLGICYEEGQGIEQDYLKAVEWYTKAAEQGDARAQRNLGICYEKGRGVEQDYLKAVEWYTKAAEQGDARVQCNLGHCYEIGLGVEQDYLKAVEWYTKAAEQGVATAQYNLGICYYCGHGVVQDYLKAVEWYTKAAEQEYPVAQYGLGLCYYFGYGVVQNYLKAVEWCTKAAEQGVATAQCILGLCYYFGQGVEQDYLKAVEWFTKAAEQGVAIAQYILGFCYEKGQGVKVNLKKAKGLYQSAKEHNHNGAEEALQRVERLIQNLQD